MPDLIFKQLLAVVDKRTTMVCLRAAGQIQPIDDPFDTLMGEIMAPPFHGHCRSMVVPWMNGFVSETRAEANAEIQKRPAKQRRFGPDGYGGSLPPPPHGTPTKTEVVQVALTVTEAALATRVTAALANLRAVDVSENEREDAAHWIATHRPKTLRSLPKWIRELVKKGERRKTR